MGKGYNNYMCKKPFHPGSKANIKRTWMAEQRTENEKKKQDDLKVQYEKEQELYNNRALISTESKDKLELNFMYEAPPGAKRERQKEDDEPEYKFEWQRKYNAPREDFAKGNAEIRDQPFGIPVRNVRCIKCHKWGHINTDKECPLFSQASTSSMPTTSMDPLELMRQMREDGYNLKQSVLGHHMNPQAANQQLLESEEEDPELEFLKSLSSKQKHKLLKKLNKMSKKDAKGHLSSGKKKKSKKKHKKDEKESKKKKTKKSHRKASDNTMAAATSESSDSSSNPEKVNEVKKIVDQTSENKSDSESSDSEDEKTKRRERKKSATQSSEEKYAGEKTQEAEDEQKESTASEIVSAKHSVKKTKGKQVSKDHSSKGNKADKYPVEKGEIQAGIKRAAEVTPPKHEGTKVMAVVKQEATDLPSKCQNEGKSSCSSSDSESSDAESSSRDDRLKRMKTEPRKDSDLVASHTQEQKVSSSVGTKASGLSSVEVRMEISEACISEVSHSPEHPDKFTCTTPPHEPETSEAPNLATFLLERKYRGDKDERFRKINRDRRSPSFKQKYRLT